MSDRFDDLMSKWTERSRANVSPAVSIAYNECVNDLFKATRPDNTIDQPACPHCGAQPLRFNMQQGPVPTGQPDGSQLLIAQAWCSSCKRQFAMQIMGVIPGQPQPADDLAGQKKPKLWSPS